MMQPALDTKAPVGLTMNQRLRRDPTRTLTLRRRFVADASLRFNRLMSEIRKLVVDEDCFGIEGLVAEGDSFSVNTSFDFPRTPEKVLAFMEWLKTKEEEGVLEVETRPGSGLALEPWSNLYIRAAYQKGIARARTEMRRIGVSVRNPGACSRSPWPPPLISPFTPTASP